SAAACRGATIATSATLAASDAGETGSGQRIESFIASPFSRLAFYHRREKPSSGRFSSAPSGAATIGAGCRRASGAIPAVAKKSKEARARRDEPAMDRAGARRAHRARATPRSAYHAEHRAGHARASAPQVARVAREGRPRVSLYAKSHA